MLKKNKPDLVRLAIVTFGATTIALMLLWLLATIFGN